MARNREELLTEALQLSIEQRSSLADSLYDSVESEMGDPDAIELAWLEEAHRRVERLDRGETELLTSAQVDAKVRALLHS